MYNFKKSVGIAAGVLAIAGCSLGLTTNSNAQFPNPPGTTVPGNGNHGKGHHGERHPELRHALMALKRADAALRSATKDYDGHREQALDFTEKAIDQVQQAIASDRK